MEKLQLRKATRRQAKLRIGITAPSGGGKTYSALLLAYGLTGNWERIAVVDTENNSAELYDHLGAFSVITLSPPFTPERFIEAIHTCEEAGMEVIALDSATAEWNGSGGCLEIQERLGGRWQDWKDVTPRHRKFIDTIIQSPAHIISCTRRVQDYDMGKDSQGKTFVTKVGMKEQQREGYEYDLTLNFELDIHHNARSSKDRTGLFMDKPIFVITEETGKKLKEWNEGGKDDPQIQKVEIVKLLKNLGFEAAGRDAYEVKVKELTGLDLTENNYAEIIIKLTPKKI